MRRTFLLPLLMLLCVGCKNNNPADPGTFIISYPYIGAFTYEHAGVMYGQLFLADTTGPVTNAAVTFYYGGGSTGATYVGPSTQSVTVNGFVMVQMITGHYVSPNFASDPAGGPCTVKLGYGSNLYQAKMTTVGNATFSPGASGITCLWAGGGNNDSVEYCNGSCVTLGASVTSPYYVPQSSLPGYTPGTYTIVSNLENDGPFGSLSSECFFNSYAEADTLY